MWRVVTVSYHDRVNVLQGQKLAGAGPFDRAEWFMLLAETAKTPAILAIAQEGEAMAALPLTKAGKQLAPLLNWYAFTWRPLISPNADAPTLLAALARGLKGQAQRVTLWPLPDEDGSARLMEQAFRQTGWIVFRTRTDSNHVLPVQGRSYAEYLASRPGQVRTTLKRKAGKLSVEILTHFQEDAWNSYEEIYRKSWKPAEGDPAMLRRFAEQEGVAGCIRLAIARHEGRPVAAQFWTVEADTAWIHKLAHLQEAQNLSPGTVLTAALMEHVIDRDHVSLVDFGTGNDAYKRDWMEEIRPRYLLDCHDPARLAGWPQLARAALRHLATRYRAG